MQLQNIKIMLTGVLKREKEFLFGLQSIKFQKKMVVVLFARIVGKKNHIHSSSSIPGSSLIIKNVTKKFKKVYYSLNPGDAVAHDSKTIHGSFNNKIKKDRIGFILCYVSKKAKQDRSLKKSYEKKIK